MADPIGIIVRFIGGVLLGLGAMSLSHSKIDSLGIDYRALMAVLVIFQLFVMWPLIVGSYRMMFPDDRD